MATARRKSSVAYKEGNNVEDAAVKVSGDTPPAGIENEGNNLARKRRRTSSGKGKGKVTARALMKSFFDIMPLDIVFDIFGLLQPLDLLHLARTNKMLRAHLMSKSSLSVWKMARLNAVPEVPDCPSDQSEPQWAHLLFTRDCTVCGTNKIQKVDWNLRIRGCKTCFKNEVVCRKTAFQRYPGIHNLDTVLQALPHSNDGGSNYGPRSSGKFYYSGAIEAMSKVIENYQTRIDAETRGAQIEMDEFIAQSIEKIDVALQHAETCREWVKKTAEQKNKTNAQLRAERKNAINDRLAALGHDPRDIDSIQWNSMYRSIIKVTDRIWDKSLRAQAEQLVGNRKIERLANVRRIILIQRETEARKTWQGFKNITEVPVLSPSTEDILSIEPFASIIHQPSDVSVAKADFDAAVMFLPAVISDWQAKQKRDLLCRSDKADEDIAVLDLATTCFICMELDTGANHSPIFHIDEWLKDHAHHSPWDFTFNAPFRPNDNACDCLLFEAKASEAVRRLVEAVGLDPETASPKDMDDVDARFYCALCSNGEGDLARTWRNLARHCSIDHPLNNLACTRLSDEDAAAIKSLELRNLDDTTKRFRFRPPHGFSGSLLSLLEAVTLQARPFDIADFVVNPTWPPTPVRLTDNFPPLPTYTDWFSETDLDFDRYFLDPSEI